MDVAEDRENIRPLPWWAKPLVVVGVWFAIFAVVAFLAENAVLAADLIAGLITLYIILILLLNMRFLVGKRRKERIKLPRHFKLVLFLGVLSLSTARKAIYADIASSAYASDKIAEYCGQLLVPIAFLLYSATVVVKIYANNYRHFSKKHMS